MPEPKLVASSLGRGLSDLIQDVAPSRTLIRTADHGFMQIPVADIHSDGELAPADPALLESVRRIGVVQAVLVRKAEVGYRLVAGRKRLAAAREAGLVTIPARILQVAEEQAEDYRNADNLGRDVAPDKSPYVAIAVRAIKTPAIAFALTAGILGGWALGTRHLDAIKADRAWLRPNWVATPAVAEPVAEAPRPAAIPLRWSFGVSGAGE